MSFFRERTHLLTGPVFTFLVLMFLFNVAVPSLTLSRVSHIELVNGEGGGTDGKPEEWFSPGVGVHPDFLVEELSVQDVIKIGLWRIFVSTILEWI